MPGKHKSVSKAQQRFFGMVHALKKGELKKKDVGPEVEDAAEDIGPRIAKQYASTKHKGLPEKKVTKECFALTSDKYKRVCELLSGIAFKKVLNEEVEKFDAIRKYQDRLNAYWNEEVGKIEKKCASNVGEYSNYNQCIGNQLGQLANNIGAKFVEAIIGFLTDEEKIFYKTEIEKMVEVWMSRKSRFIGLETNFAGSAGNTDKGPQYAPAQGALVGNPSSKTTSYT